MMFEPIFAYKILQLKFMDNLFVNTSILYFICIVSVIKKQLIIRISSNVLYVWFVQLELLVPSHKVRKLLQEKRYFSKPRFYQEQYVHNPDLTMIDKVWYSIFSIMIHYSKRYWYDIKLLSQWKCRDSTMPFSLIRTLHF